MKRGEDAEALPMPIQTFLWRQSSPFIRPKFGRQQISTAMEQREACKSLEKVLVQNIQFGLSPSLTEAITSVSRWRLIQAALPHVMHCASALLYNRKLSNFDKLGAAETKLLYTLHWIILDATEECSDAELEQGIRRPFDHYLLPVATLELFVYLFAPLTPYLKGSDFLSCFRLENGYKIWDPIFQFRHPDIPSFVAHAKPKKDIFSGQHFEKKTTAKFGDVFMGGSTDKEKEDPGSAQELGLQPPLSAPTSTPAATPAETPSADRVSVFADPLLSQIPFERRSSRTAPETAVPESKPKSTTNFKPLKDPIMATYFDVAVLRCLFRSQWIEEGVDWTLKFIINRLNDVKDAQSTVEKPLHRSNSLPNLKCEFKRRTTTYLDDDSEHLTLAIDADIPDDDASRRPSVGAFSLPGDQLKQKKAQKKKRSRKKCEASNDSLAQSESKADAEAKKRRTKKTDWKVLKKALIFASHETLPPAPRRPGSSLGICSGESDQKNRKDVLEQKITSEKIELSRGKSMPSLHLLDRRSSSSDTPTKPIETETLDDSDSSSALKKLPLPPPIPKPIITITEHSPVASIQFFMNNESAPADRLKRKGKLVRSKSDKDIQYFTSTNAEVAGSTHYVTKDGHFSLTAVLKAVHSVSVRENTSSLRTCGSCVKVMRQLLDMDMLKKFDMGSVLVDEEEQSKRRRDRQKEPEELSIHNLFVATLMSVIKRLGCPNGCNEGFRGPNAEKLRKEVREVLLILYTVNEEQFISYFLKLVSKRHLQEVLDYFHAFVGFCVDVTVASNVVKRSAPAPDSVESRPRTAYANNFGAGYGRIGPRGIEGVIIDKVFKVFVTRAMTLHKELKLQDNLSMYCELRQLVTYVKDAHGGTFRKTLLSALFDSTERLVADDLMKKLAKQTTPDSDGRTNMIPTSLDDLERGGSQGHKRSFFRKRSAAGIKSVASTQSITDDFTEQWTISAGAPLGLLMNHNSSPSLLKVNRSVSPRLSITDDDVLAAAQGKHKAHHAKFPFVNWLKGDKGLKITTDLVDFPDNGVNGHLIPLEKLSDHLSRRPSAHQRQGPKSSMTFIRGAKKRVEDQFSKMVFGKGKHKQNDTDEPIEMSRRSSLEFFHPFREGGLVPFKETRLVSIPAIKTGMLRFAFLMETCAPGSLPDPPLLAAVLDLKAPVAARAAFYLECAHFVHACNRGQWPSWMKLSIPMLRQSGPGKSLTTARRGSMSHGLYRSAGRMFYQWAEAIGARIEDMELRAEKPPSVNLDDNKKRCLRNEDEEEDFLNESSVNPNGNDCPFALKMAATQVLLEITAFLRESHQYLPMRSSRTSVSNMKPPERAGGGVEARAITANRRWSMALSSLGFSQNSAHSLMSLADAHPQLPPPGERRISFVLHEADGEVNSLHSSTGSKLDSQEARHERQMSQSNVSPSVSGPNRAHLLRRATGGGQSSGSFKRRSFKLKKGERKGRHRSATIDDIEETNLTLGPNSIMKRADSMRSRAGRRVSGISERSDASGAISGEESPGMLSDDGQGAECPVDNLNADDTEIVRSFPWIKVVVGLINGLDFECQHQHFCHPKCYKRQVRSCRRLVHAIKQVYKPEPVVQEKPFRIEDKEDLAKREKRLRKIVTGAGPTSTSPIRRKTSAGHNMDKMEKDHYASLHSSTTAINQIDLEAGVSEEFRKKYKFEAPKQKAEDPPALKYIKNQVKDLFHNPLSMMLKATLVLPSNFFIEQLILAWEMLLDDDHHLASVAASAFIVASVKCPEVAAELLTKELQSEDPAERIKAITKFYCIWRARHMCWPRMEEGAQLSFKVPPAGIEFTLPSPKIALDTMPVANPPWMPAIKGKVEEVTISQEQAVQKSIVTATKTRRKQQMEMVRKVIEQEQEKMREERESYRISAVPANMQASYEPALFHSVEDHAGNEEDEQADERQEARPHVQIAQSMFPSCLCTASLAIINLLEDASVSSSGSAAYEVAFKVIWHCLVEDTALFLRHFFEKITKEKQKEIFQILRRLIRFMPRLPAQAAYTLYNYLIGFVMFNVRTPSEGNHELVGATLSLLWLVVPSVHGLFLKDLKQILRKEQCDADLLITANVPSAKKIIVYGPEVGGIPSQFPIQEDTQFYQILVDSLDFFGIDDSLMKEYYLLDAKTNEIHNLSAFVRDFYFFRRSQYPQLALVRMNPGEAFEKLQKQAFNLQFLEVGKALMSLSIVKSNYLSIQRVLFLHEELMKLPSFPRKALEAHFSLYKGSMGKNMLGMDTLHKIVWIRLVARMFDVTSGFFAQSSDIHLFVNVLNGALILHCEDAAVLRLCMATYINLAHQFKNIFAINGYLLIMPTLLRIYSNHQSNGLLCKTIEFVCKQLYIMHRKPFLLQMFGSAAPILDTDTTSNIGDAAKIQPLAFFKLLQSFGQYIGDPLDILELVEFEKPLKALDFCYQMDPEIISILDNISLCVTVVSYSADCMRSHQMLTILETILPLYMKHLQGSTLRKETPGGPRAELQMIHNLSLCVRTLVSNCEPLARNFSGPQRAMDLRGSSIRGRKGQMSPPIEIDDDSHSKYMPETYTTPSRSRQNFSGDEEDNEEIRHNFRRPRDTLLNLVSEFLTRSTARLADLSKKVPDLHQKGSSYELLDVKSHLRLAEVAHSLLKVAPYDRQTMGCRGLIRYMTEVLPTSEWRQEKMRPALIIILRRLDKMFQKISKKNVMKRATDWEAAKRLLKGVYLTFTRHPYIVHLPHLKSLINVTQTIVLGDPSQVADASASLPQWAAVVTPPAGFSSVAVRLIAMQMLQMGESQTLEIVCGPNLSQDKAETFLMNLIYPMAIRISGGLKDVPRFRLCDVSFTLTMILNALNPSIAKSGSSKGGGSDSNSCQTTQYSIHMIGFLGLKILMVCFERLLGGEWNKIARCVREMSSKNIGGITMWNFLDFVVAFRTPLFVLLLPMIRCKILERICSTDQEYYYQQQIKQKLIGRRLPSCRCKGQLLVSLLAEMRQLRDDLVNKKFGQGEKKIVNAEQSLSHRLSFAITSAFQAGGKGSPAVSSPQTSTPVDPNSPLEKGPASLTRVFSFRDRPTLPIRGLSVKLPMHRDGRKGVDRSMRRTSYPYNLDESFTVKEGDAADGNQHTSSEPKLFRKSTLLIKMRNSKRGTAATVSPAKEKSPEDSSLTETIEEAGEDSTKELSREDDVSGDDPEEKNRHRLRRQKAQSKKACRFHRPQKEKSTDMDQVLSSDASSTDDKFRVSLQGDDDPADETSRLGISEERKVPAEPVTEKDEPGN